MSGAVVWITGLPASGKSTLAARLAERLRAAGDTPLVLDGDEVREAIVPRPGHDAAGREAFYATLGRLACLAAHQQLIAIVPATANRRAWRDAARACAPRWIEVYVATPLEECMRRDPKGLYANAEVRPHLPGVGEPYEPPLAPDVTSAAGDDPRAVDEILALLSSRTSPPRP